MGIRVDNYQKDGEHTCLANDVYTDDGEELRTWWFESGTGMGDKRWDALKSQLQVLVQQQY